MRCKITHFPIITQFLFINILKQDEIILERYLNRFVSHIEYYCIFTDEQKAVSEV